MPIPRFNGKWSADYVRDVVLREVAVYESCVTERMLRSFDNLRDEISAKALALVGSIRVTEEGDDGAMEWVGEEAEQWAMDVSAVYWGVTALFVAGLFHSLEQHAADLLRQAENDGTSFWEVAGRQSRLEDFDAWLQRDLAIDLKTCAQWEILYNELQHVANVVKHAEGRSANKLRERRPDLFAPPEFASLGGWEKFARKPLMGDGLFVTEEEFKSYSRTLREFWSWLADRLEQVPWIAQ